MVKKKKKALNNRGHIMARYGCMVALFLVVCALIIGKLAVATVVDADAWNKRAERELAQTVEIAPERGSILSCNGNIMACNETLYDVRIDLRHPKFGKLDARKWASLDSLADSLDLHYPRTEQMRTAPDPESADSWRSILHTQLNLKPSQRRSNLRVGRKLPLAEFDRMRGWPFFNQISRKTSCPLYSEEHVIRVTPFGDMARLSIGRVYEDSVSGRTRGYAGIEKALDSLLYGTPGRARKVAMNHGLADWVVTPPRRGYDVITTIDIDMQDILEQELRAMCDSVHAEWGTAVLMEVATGEIKAITNMEPDTVNGGWTEAMNRAVQRIEPGSVLKTISLMVALEDGIVNSIGATADCSPFMGTSDPHGGGMKTMKQIIEQSSNTGISRVIFRRYGDHPEQYSDRLKETGMFEPMHSGIGGEQTAWARPLPATTQDGSPVTLKARQMQLARQAFGYGVEVPPLYTLSYYNAIANNGRYVRPHLVRALRDENGRDSIIPISYIRDHVCSEANAAKLRECVHEVVWGDHGTARALKDDRVELAGKTGTAYPYSPEMKKYDMSRRRYAFCGFFPYNNPKYSCIVVIRAKSGATTAGGGSGRVMLNTALRLYAKGLLSDNATAYTASTAPAGPVLYGAQGAEPRLTATGLGAKNPRRLATPSSGTAAPGTVPDVRGLDAAAAVRALETRGFNVTSLRGQGAVTAQSLAPGTRAPRGARVMLTLAFR